VGTPLFGALLALREQHDWIKCPRPCVLPQHRPHCLHGSVFNSSVLRLCCRWTLTHMLSLFAAAARRSALDAGKNPTAPAPVSWRVGATRALYQQQQVLVHDAVRLLVICHSTFDVWLEGFAGTSAGIIQGFSTNANACCLLCTGKMWTLWDEKINGDSETKNWMAMNTKPCPRCTKPVEKSGGCNLVVCTCGQVRLSVGHSATVARQHPAWGDACDPYGCVCQRGSLTQTPSFTTRMPLPTETRMQWPTE
jgi:hypothetical protein